MLRAVVAMLALAAAGCGDPDDRQADAPVPTDTTAAPTPQAPTPAASANGNAATVEETTPTEETVPTEEASEAEEAPENPAAKTTAGPALRLATVEAKPAPRSAFKEGVHFQRLTPTQPTAVSVDQVEVIEIFWYGCPQCFALDTKLETWRKNAKAPYIQFRRVPGIWNDITAVHARVFYAAESLGKLEELHTPIFREIQVNGNALNTMDRIKAFFKANGVAAAEFDKKYSALEVEQKMQSAGLLARRYRMQGVPFFVVNGKYTTDVQLAGGEDQLLLLIADLAAREHNGL